MTTTETKTEQKKEEKKPEGSKPPEASVSHATVIVSLPADAKLYIEDQPTQSVSSSRTFVSPKLDAGKDYFYTLRAEIVVDGKTVSMTRQLTVRAGETVSTSFEFANAAVAAK